MHRDRSLIGVVGCVLLAAGLLICTGVRQPANKAGNSRETDGADVAFQNESWQRARGRYAALLKSEKDWYSPRARRAVERSVICSLKLKGWSAALDLVEKTRDWKRETDVVETWGNRNSGFALSGLEEQVEKESSGGQSRLSTWNSATGCCCG